MLAQGSSLVRRGTPQLTLGPFYPLDRLADQDADLTRIAGRPGRAQGMVVEILGRVVDEGGAPVPGAMLDVWQTNALGSYHHPSDPSGAPRDPDFQGAALIRADREGRYRLLTVLPAPYSSRQRHIHFDVRGRRRRLVTQMFFPGEPNEADAIYRSLGNAELQAAVTGREAGGSGEPGVKRYEWTVALAGE